MLFNTLKWPILYIVFMMNIICGQKSQVNGNTKNGIHISDIAPVNEPRKIGISNTLTIYNFEQLAQVKKAIQNGNEYYGSAYDKLLRAADKAFKEGPFSVMEKKQIAPSGDKHDYLSLAPYWWPDPDKDDGLPWIRKDGKINPLTRGENVDDPAKDKMIHNVKTLSLAYFFSGNIIYADKTKELLKVWFVDEATKMKPNLNYAQGVPGSSVGRGFGVIEFAGIENIITAIEVLEMENELEPKLGNALRKWMSNYLKWLQTSELGLFEKSRKNNHGTFYDVQEVSLLLFFDRTEEARAVLESVVQNRIDPQIEPDGKQLHELERTKALTYSILNLSGLTKLAFFGKKEGVNIDLWNYKSPSGDIQKAYDYLLPFVDKVNQWPYQQLGNIDDAIERLRQMFVITGSMHQIEEYCKMNITQKNKYDINRLLYPCLP